jgi:tetratricopeptide (TPR) repeat protein
VDFIADRSNNSAGRELSAVASLTRIRRQRILQSAEGYLELEMPDHALAAISRLTVEEMNGIAFHLKGEALRAVGRYAEAIPSLRQAAEGAPGDVHIWLSLGWCYKRINRIDMAIESLEEALEAEPNEAIVHYNLACYWSLAGNKRNALLFLSQALELDADFRDKIASESDFDAIRSDPQFRSLASVVV